MALRYSKGEHGLPPETDSNSGMQGLRQFKPHFKQLRNTFRGINSFWVTVTLVYKHLK